MANLWPMKLNLSSTLRDSKIIDEEVWLDPQDHTKHSVFCNCKECMKNVKIGSTLQIKIPEDYQVKESKMTREEAIKEFRKAFRETASYSEGLIKGLETLGLIKFEEEITPEAIFEYYYHTPKAITNHLDRMGFKVVKK